MIWSYICSGTKILYRIKTIMETTLNRNNTFFRRLLFLGILIAIGWIILDQLNFFIGSFLGAFTLYVVLRAPLFRLTERYGMRPWIASAMLVVAMTVVLLGLGFLFFEVIASEISDIDTSRIIAGFNHVLARFNEWLGFQIVPENIIKNSGNIITKLVSGLLDTTYSFVVNVFLMLVIVYFMLTHARRMERVVEMYLPFKGYSLAMLKKEVHGIIFSNAVGIPLVMLMQSLAALIIYWALGIPNCFFWAFFTGLCGLIPMVGTVIVSVPIGIYLIATGAIWQGIVMIAYGLLVIANVDNLCRIILMQRIANTHPLIVIFGVIMGIPLFGFWGIIFGPLLISGFLLLIKIYYREYRLIDSDEETQGETTNERVE